MWSREPMGSESGEWSGRKTVILAGTLPQEYQDLIIGNEMETGSGFQITEATDHLRHRGYVTSAAPHRASTLHSLAL